MTLTGSELDLEDKIVEKLAKFITKASFDQMGCKKRLDIHFWTL